MLGALVAAAALWAQDRDAPQDEGGASPQAEDAMQETGLPCSASVAIPTDPKTWKRMSQSELEAVGRRVAETTALSQRS